jgi:glycosyltransferase involved in cell wall biosynthesis
MVVSVALCTYNGGKFIEGQLNSILNQTVKVDEIVVCDDVSSDNTLVMLETYKKKFPNLIKIFTNDVTLGTIKNFEKVISLTKGDLIFLADQDDIWYENKVEVMVNFFQENRDCTLLFSNGSLIDENGINLNATLWEKWGFDKNLRALWSNNNNAFKDLIINNNKITGATVCFKSMLKGSVLPINIPKGYWHDAWLGLHAAANGGLMFLETCLINYRIHENQQVGISSDAVDTATTNENKKFITKETYFKRIKKMYPLLREHVPLSKKNIFEKVIFKIKNYLKSFSN